MKRLFLASASLCALLAAAGGAAAQESNGIGEVVVTAQKRVENVQNVSISVTAVAPEALQREGVNNITDLQRVAPEITISTGSNQNITVRGVRTGAYGPTTDSPIAVNLDGVYLSRFTSLNGLFFDLERVEVLSGPQGTLYGRNAAGGAVNLITAKPGRKFGGLVSLELGNYGAVIGNAAMNIPLTDTLSVRVAYNHNAHNGYFTDSGQDDADLNSARLSARWTPSAKDSLLITADGSNTGGKFSGGSTITQVLKQPTILSAANGSISSVAQGTPGGVTVPIQVTDSPDHNRVLVGDADRVSAHVRTRGVMAQFDHDFDFANLTIQASRRSLMTNNTTGTTSGLQQDPRLITTAVIRPPTIGFNPLHSVWDSEEARLTSPSNQTITYVVGLYRFHEHSWDNHSGTYALTYPNTSAATIGQIIFPNPLTTSADTVGALNDDDAYAAFGQGTWSPAPIPNLHVTVGLRYNSEHKHGIGSIVTNGVTNPRSAFDLAATWKATTYKFNLAYDFTPHNMVYFDHSTGFKSGGFAYGINAQYKPENIRAYEIGTKNRFFDNKLQVNAAAWYYNYKNYVATVQDYYFDNTLGRPNSLLNTANAPGLSVTGQSVGIDWSIARDDRLGFDVQHLHTKFTNFDVGPRYLGANGGVNAFAAGLLPGLTPADFNFTGRPLANEADWTINANYDHTFHVLGGTLDGELAWHYLGERLPQSPPSTNTLTYIVGKPYSTFDLSARFAPGMGDWTITGYVRNFTNERYATNSYVSNASGYPLSDSRVFWAYYSTAYSPPRTFGVIFAAKF